MRRKIIVLASVGIIMGALALGFVDSEQLRIWAGHLYLVGRYEASKLAQQNPLGNIEHARICRGNLDRLQAAKRKIAEMRSTAVGAVTWEEVIAVMYPDKVRRGVTPALVEQLKPRCPSGGTYTLGNIQDLPKCSIGSNNNTDPNDDHLIRH
ncbi:MAG: hypothetical protein N2Z21_02825 [Candidatus Sumerlaeaceae bacterium]|nr:hypothetical protein [Candidatus Sumerlaeaceae bacterium]